MVATNKPDFLAMARAHDPQHPLPAAAAVTEKPKTVAPPTGGVGAAPTPTVKSDGSINSTLASALNSAGKALTPVLSGAVGPQKSTQDALIRPGGAQQVKAPNVLQFMYATGANSQQAVKAIKSGIWRNYIPENGWEDASKIQGMRSNGQWAAGDGSQFEWKYNDYAGDGQILPYYRKWANDGSDYTLPSFMVISGNGGQKSYGSAIPMGLTKREFEIEARLQGASQQALDNFAKQFGYNTFESLNWDWAVKEGRSAWKDQYKTFDGTYRRDPNKWQGEYAVRGDQDMPYLVRADGTRVPLNEVEGSGYFGVDTTKNWDPKKGAGAGLMAAALGGRFGQGGGTPTAFDLMTRYSSKDNPLMAQARGQAMQIANSRGLLNSSIATQAGEEAALGTVLPLASQDADNAAQKERLGMELSSRERIALAQIGSQERLAQLDLTSRERMQANEISYQQGERALDRSLQEQLAQWNLSSTDRDGAMRSVISMEQLYNTQYANIMANTNLSAEDRAAQLTAAKNLRDVQLDLIQQLYGISLDWNQAA